MKNKKITVPGELALLLGLLLNSLGVALYAKSGAGINSISLTAYVLSKTVPVFTLGIWNFVFQTCIMTALVIIMRRTKPGYVLSFALSMSFGLFIDMWEIVLSIMPESTLGLLFSAPGDIGGGWLTGVLYFAIGFWAQGFGTHFLVVSGIPVLPFETFMRDISERFSIKVKTIKTVADLFCLAFSVTLALSIKGQIIGVGPGTVISAFLQGTAIAYCGKLLNRVFEFKPKYKFLERLAS